MYRLKDIKLLVKFNVLFLAIGIIPFAAIGLMSMNKAGNALSRQSFNQLEAVREIKKAQIERFFEERKGDMGVLIETVATLQEDAFRKLEAVQQIKKAQVEGYFKERYGDVTVLAANDSVARALLSFKQEFDNEGGRVGGGGWSRSDQLQGQWLKQFKKIYGYYDLFLISKDGDVVWTASRESDLGQNVKSGKLKDSPLGRCFEKALNNPAIADFEPYAPSNGRFAAFIGAPVRKDDQLIGTVILQLPTEPVNTIVQRREGMGKTGETFLVGNYKGRTAFRSDMRTMGDGKYVVGYNISTDYIDRAISGDQGTDVVTDSKGNLLIVSYAPLTIEGLDWACVSKINLEEAIAPIRQGEKKDFYASYIEKYGYYDLFLIHRKGKVFYSVTHEADYGTNMVDGVYASSGLGRLTRSVLETKAFGMVDFQPYSPSNNEPAAFIAQPIMHNGELEIVVALQLSIDAISDVMNKREGMGKTGETYLVGQDNLMRSDSYLDPDNHSVKTSFAHPDKGSVKTVAVEKALKGETGNEVTIGYSGHPVLSAYTLLDLQGVKWALLAEIHEQEAFAAIKSLKWVMAVTALIGICAIFAITLPVTRSITRPINDGVLFAEAISKGDLTQALDLDQKDEIGIMAAALNRMASNLREMFENIAGGVETLTSSSTELSAISQQMAAGSEQSSVKAQTVSVATEEMNTNMQAMATASEQTSTNVQIVATATEQMTSTISEIANNTEHGRMVASEAVEKTKLTAVQVTELGNAVQQIGKVTEVIAEISEQTNLLALNATIEAARAGEAGKGFAVVANEIKDLAKQTADATRQIGDQISNIQHKTGDTVEKIDQISTVIHDLNELVATVASAMEEQSAATKEIATNVNQAAQGIEEVNKNVTESTNVSGSIARDMDEVNHAAREIATGSSRVSSSAQNLHNLAEKLNQMISKFKISA